MNIKKILSDQKETIDEITKDTRKKYDRKELISLLSTIFFGTIGLFTTITMPLYGISVLGLAAGCYLKNKSLCAREKKEIERLKKEKRHIDKIQEKGLDVRRETNKKRINKVNSLLDENKKRNDNYKSAKLADNIALIALGGSVVLSVLLPVIGLAGTGLSAIAKLYTGSKLEESHDALELNRLRANNLITDINTIKLVQANAKEKRSKQVSEQQKKVYSSKNNINQVTARRPQAVSNNNNQAVQELLEKLLKEQEKEKGKEQEKQKVKRK